MTILFSQKVLHPVPEPFDGALSADRALGLMLHLFSNGDPVQNSQPHHRLGLQVDTLQELGRFNDWLAGALEKQEIQGIEGQISCCLSASHSIS